MEGYLLEFDNLPGPTSLKKMALLHQQPLNANSIPRRSSSLTNDGTSTHRCCMFMTAMNMSDPEENVSHHPSLASSSHSQFSNHYILQNEASLTKLSAALRNFYKHKYLDVILAACPFSKISVVNSIIGPKTSQQ